MKTINALVTLAAIVGALLFLIWEQRAWFDRTTLPKRERMRVQEDDTR